ncbi:MAG: sigma-70 family RNA polymerase sigma factor, partial [Planctomycetota bacterium]
DLFVRGYIKLDTFKRDSQFFTWLYRIAFNSALGNRRKAKKKYSLDEMRENLGEEPILEDDAPDASIIRDEDVSLIRRAMERLSDAHRDILVLREMQDHAYEEIAAILSISIGTVRSRLSRARASLKEQIETLQTK